MLIIGRGYALATQDGILHVGNPVLGFVSTAAVFQTKMLAARALQTIPSDQRPMGIGIFEVAIVQVPAADEPTADAAAPAPSSKP